GDGSLLQANSLAQFVATIEQRQVSLPQEAQCLKREAGRLSEYQLQALSAFAQGTSSNRHDGRALEGASRVNLKGCRMRVVLHELRRDIVRLIIRSLGIPEAMQATIIISQGQITAPQLAAEVRWLGLVGQ